MTGLADYVLGLTANKALDAELRFSAKDVLTNIYSKTGDYKNAIQTGEELLKQQPETEHEYTTLFNLFNIYQKDLRDEDNAKKYLELLKEKYKDYELTLFAQFDMGEKVDGKLGKRFSSQPRVHIQTESLPENYSLGDNYPNPFNPRTWIPFAIPEEAHVKLTIYDILGREVVSLVDEDVSAGFNRVSWNGRDCYGNQVANGMYIYRLETKKYAKSCKLLLIK